MGARKIFATARCRDCSRPIVFLVMPDTGRKVPVDALTATPYDREFVPNGRHRSHLDTCPARQTRPTPERPAKRRPLFGYDD